MDKYLIVTGANGYLGKYVCLEALNSGYKIIALKYNHYRSTILNHPDIQYVYADITSDMCNHNELKSAIEGKNITGIVNAAALLGSSDYDKNYAVNAEGVKNVIDFAQAHKINKVVQISSVVVMKKIKGPYGVTKLKGQEILEQSDINYTTFIPAMILGPESLGINRVLKNVFRFPMLIPLIGSGKQTQHPIYVKDFAHYIVKSVENENTTKKTYQIASESVIPFKELIKLILKIRNKKKMFVPVPVFIAKLLGKFFQAVQKVPVFTAEHVKGVLQDSKLDTSMLKQDLDFKPTPLEIALTETLKEIGTSWSEYLVSREEITIDLKKN